MGRGARLVLAVAALAATAWGIARYAPEHLPASLRPGAAAVVSPDNPPLYKWRDDAGVWQITDRPPEGRAYETIVVPAGQNVVPSTAPVN